MFTKIEGRQAVIQQAGVSRVCDLYVGWDQRLYAGYGGGYIALKATGSTSKDMANVKFLEYNGPLYADAFEHLYTVPVEGKTKKMLKVEPGAQQLLIAVQES